MDEALIGDLLLAVVGLDRVLGDEPVKITQAMREGAQRLPAKMIRELRRFLLADSFDRFVPPAPINYKRVLDRLLAPPDDAARIEQLAQLADPLEQMQLNVAANRALVVLRPLVPVLARQTITGPRHETPSDVAVARLRRALAIVADPAAVLAAMNAGTLLREEAGLLEAVFPKLYDALKGALPGLLTQIVSERPRFELVSRRDRLLRVLLGGPTMDPALAKRLHEPFDQAAKGGGGGGPSPRPGPSAPDVAKQTETQVQRVSSA